MFSKSRTLKVKVELDWSLHFGYLSTTDFVQKSLVWICNLQILTFTFHANERTLETGPRWLVPCQRGARFSKVNTKSLLMILSPEREKNNFWNLKLLSSEREINTISETRKLKSTFSENWGILPANKPSYEGKFGSCTKSVAQKWYSIELLLVNRNLVTTRCGE